MKRVLLAVAAGAAAFVALAVPSGVWQMIDSDYCFDHPERPTTATFHEERLSVVPPGPVCVYSVSSGGDVPVGPGWWPAACALTAGAAAFVVVRLSP